jgi:ribonucleotide monophosphatase NagD (HAD superfamily)
MDAPVNSTDTRVYPSIHDIQQGVVWLEDELIGHARLAIEYFRKHKIGVAFVSNNATA